MTRHETATQRIRYEHHAGWRCPRLFGKDLGMPRVGMSAGVQRFLTDRRRADRINLTTRRTGDRLNDVSVSRFSG